MIYAYLRVSSKEQNLDRQIVEIRKHEITNTQAYTELGISRSQFFRLLKGE